MSKPEWGSKHTCQNCGTKYYDLRSSPAVCPSCSTEFDPDALLRSRRIRTAAPAKATPAPAPVAVAAVAVAAPEPEVVAEAEEAVEPVAVAANDDAEEIAGDDKIDTLIEDEEGDEDLIEDASELGEDDDDVADVVVKDDKEEDR